MTENVQMYVTHFYGTERKNCVVTMTWEELCLMIKKTIRISSYVFMLLDDDSVASPAILSDINPKDRMDVVQAALSLGVISQDEARVHREKINADIDSAYVQRDVDYLNILIRAYGPELRKLKEFVSHNRSLTRIELEIVDDNSRHPFCSDLVPAVADIRTISWRRVRENFDLGNMIMVNEKPYFLYDEKYIVSPYIVEEGRISLPSYRVKTGYRKDLLTAALMLGMISEDDIDKFHKECDQLDVQRQLIVDAIRFNELVERYGDDMIGLMPAKHKLDARRRYNDQRIKQEQLKDQWIKQERC